MAWWLQKKNNYDEIVEELKDIEGYDNYLRDKKTILENLDIYDNDLITKGKENFEENSEISLYKKTKIR